MIVEATFKVPAAARRRGALRVAGAVRSSEALELAQRCSTGARASGAARGRRTTSAAEALGSRRGARALVIGCAGASGRTSTSRSGGLRELSRGTAAARARRTRGDALRRALSDFSQPADDEASSSRLSAAADGARRVPAAVEIESAARARASSPRSPRTPAAASAWCQLLGAPNETVARGRRRAAARRGAPTAARGSVFESLPPALRGRRRSLGLRRAGAARSCAASSGARSGRRLQPGRGSWEGFEERCPSPSSVG